MQLNISKAGIVLVFVPLTISVLFILALSILLLKTENASTRAFRAAQISNQSNKLIRDLFEVGSMTRGEVLAQMKSEDYRNMVSTLRHDLQELSRTVQGDLAEERIVRSCAEASEEAFELVDHIRTSLGASDNILATDQSDSVRRRLRSCIKRMVSRELLTMAQDEKEKSEASHLQQARFRKQINTLLLVGVLLNIAISILVAAVFSRRITSRLKVLVDNSFRLASGLQLENPIGGADEIAEVDITFHNMATALAEAKQKEKSLVEHSLDLICSLDQNKRFTAANPACHRILGYSEKELLGVSFKTLLVDEDVEHVDKAISKAMAEKTEAKFETRVKHKEGKEVDLDWSVQWVPLERLLFCVGHDISERKEVERLKQRFMAMISHDLRAPLSVMTSYLQMSAVGLFGELNERGMHLLKVAEKNGDRMLSLINDLLDLEKSETGRLTMNKSAVELNDVLQQCVSSIQSLAQRQEVNLDLASTNLTVFADPHRLSQVLVNLVGNAIKFSPKEKTVKVWAEQTENMAFVYVADEGRGVPEHLKEVIFERFHQVEVADAIEKGGSGLGLAISKVIIELHGGYIKVENNNGPGCTFSFSLPLAETQDSPSQKSTDLSSQPACESQA